MSRGYWDYRDESLRDEIFGYSDISREKILDADDKVCDAFKDREISELIHDVFAIMYARDSDLCGDWSHASYLEVVAQFKKKWLNKSEETRTKYFIDKAVSELKKEFYKTYGIHIHEHDD